MQEIPAFNYIGSLPGCEGGIKFPLQKIPLHIWQVFLGNYLRHGKISGAQIYLHHGKGLYYLKLIDEYLETSVPALPKISQRADREHGWKFFHPQLSDFCKKFKTNLDETVAHLSYEKLRILELCQILKLTPEQLEHKRSLWITHNKFANLIDFLEYEISSKDLVIYPDLVLNLDLTDQIVKFDELAEIIKDQAYQTEPNKSKIIALTKISRLCALQTLMDKYPIDETINVLFDCFAQDYFPELTKLGQEIFLSKLEPMKKIIIDAIKYDNFDKFTEQYVKKHPDDFQIATLFKAFNKIIIFSDKLKDEKKYDLSERVNNIMQTSIKIITGSK